MNGRTITARLAPASQRRLDQNPLVAVPRSSNHAGKPLVSRPAHRAACRRHHEPACVGRAPPRCETKSSMAADLPSDLPAPGVAADVDCRPPRLDREQQARRAPRVRALGVIERSRRPSRRRSQGNPTVRGCLAGASCGIPGGGRAGCRRLDGGRRAAAVAGPFSDRAESASARSTCRRTRRRGQRLSTSE